MHYPSVYEVSDLVQSALHIRSPVSFMPFPHCLFLFCSFLSDHLVFVLFAIVCVCVCVCGGICGDFCFLVAFFSYRGSILDYMLELTGGE